MCKHMKFFFKQKFVIERREIVDPCKKNRISNFLSNKGRVNFPWTWKNWGEKTPNNKKLSPETISGISSIIFLAHNCPLSWSYLKNCDIFLILSIIGLGKYIFFVSDLWGRAQCSVPGSRWSARCHETHISAYQTPLVMTPFVLNICCPSFQMAGSWHLVCIQSSAAMI